MASAGNSSFNWNAFAQGVGAGLSAYNPNQPLASMGAAVTASSRAVAGDQQQAQGLALRQQERDEARDERVEVRAQQLADAKEARSDRRTEVMEGREFAERGRLQSQAFAVQQNETRRQDAKEDAAELKKQEEIDRGIAVGVSYGNDTPAARAQKAAMQNQFGYFPDQFRGARTAPGPSPTFEFTSEGAAQFLNITGAGGQSAFNLDPMNKRL